MRYLQSPGQFHTLGTLCILFTVLLIGCLTTVPAHSQATEETTNITGDLAEMSLDDLMGIKITTVSRKQQRLTDTAAAAYVINQEDIRRSGATSIPELLRMVPGMDVAQINSSSWNISPRGLEQVFSKMILVQIDGRTIDTPIFSGVNWDVVDTMLEDIERIEIIRGPGSSLWGANAVNGVINIITKNAMDTQGPLISSTFSNDGLPTFSARYGGKYGENTHYRVYVKGFDRKGYDESTNNNIHDRWQQKRVGFRIDAARHKDTSLTIQGDVYKTNEDESFNSPDSIVSNNTIVSGSNLLTKWTSTAPDGRSTSLQMYYDITRRHSTHLPETRNTLDIDLQNRLSSNINNEVVWGLTYRHSKDSISGSGPIEFGPSTGVTQKFSVFGQDEIKLIGGRDCLTIGSIVEYNSITGWEFQPNLRYLHKISEHRTVWFGVSRTVTTPSRGEDRADINVQPPLDSDSPPPPGEDYSDSNLNSEKMITCELGYRTNMGKRASIDIATFYNSYDRLRGLVYDGKPTVQGIVSTDIINTSNGYSYGLEIAPKWNLTDRWSLTAAYSLYKENQHSPDPSELLITSGGSPKNKLNLRSFMDLRKGRELDIFAYYVDKTSITQMQDSPIEIPAYLRVDVRYGWHAANSVEISIGAQNLCNTVHNEYASPMGKISTEIPRTYYIRTTWQL